MLDFLNHVPDWIKPHNGLDLILPLLLTLWIAAGDLKTRRIPNYLTFGGALAGLGFQLGFHGWGGLGLGLLGLALGFALLLLPYLMGGMGAGDVKALAAMGAWLGPRQTFWLFIYMALAGGVLALGILLWKGLLWYKIRVGWAYLFNLALTRSSGPSSPAPPGSQTPGLPYGVALALGMIFLFWRG